MPTAPNGTYIPDTYLIYGGPSTGKTSLLLQWAKLHPESPVYVFDGDNKFRRVWLAEYPDVTNVEYIPVTTWEDTYEKFNAVRTKLMKLPLETRERYCFGFEMVDKYWEWVQEFYHSAIRKMTRAQFLMYLKESKPEQVGLSDADSQTMWRLIKDAHNTDFLDYTINTLRCNAILTAPAHDLSTVLRQGKPQESPEALALYSSVGVKPEGEKRNGYRVDTIIYLEHDLKTKKRMWTTIKDKARPGGICPVPHAWREPYTDFWAAYMAKVGTTI